MEAIRRQAMNMDPSQMHTMQQQAKDMFKSMTPEQRRAATEQASTLDPDTLAQQAQNVPQYASAQQNYLIDGANSLKAEGNRLHGEQKFAEAAAKYSHALKNIEGNSTPAAEALRVSCHSNLASCYLQLRKWDECIAACDVVLRQGSSNRKALYRRGQANSGLGKYIQAVQDLRRALELSPESEKDVIREKLEEAEQHQQHAQRGVIIEEVVSDNDSGEDGAIEDVVVEEKEEEEREVVLPPPPPPAAVPEMSKVAEMMKQDPDMVRKNAEMIASMSDTELAAHLAAAGGASGMPPGTTPEMARAAAQMMKNLSTDQIAAMADQAAKGAYAMPVPPPPSRATATATSMEQQAAAAAQMMKQDPSALKHAAKMIEEMTPEQLDAMASSMPGAPSGMKIDPAQMKMAAKMMENMSAEDLERMTQMAAATMNQQQPATTTTAAAAPTVAAVPGAAPHFDPGASTTPTADMMATMRKQMADPAMLKSMQSMLSSMDPETLAGMMRSSGMNVTPEQAKKMVDSMGGLSDRQLEWISRLTAAVNAVVEVYQRAKAWAMANTAMALALVLLLLFLFCRWLGWV